MEDRNPIPHSLTIDIDYDRQEAMDEVLSSTLTMNPVDYGWGADINCQVPRAIMRAFKHQSWDWHIGIWMYRDSQIEPHRDRAQRLEGNQARYDSGTLTRTCALWFPLYGDYRLSPLGIHYPRDPYWTYRKRHVCDVFLDRPILVDMGLNYLHSMDNRHGHIIWYCLNFDPPETLQGAYERVVGSLA